MRGQCNDYPSAAYPYQSSTMAATMRADANVNEASTTSASLQPVEFPSQPPQMELPIPFLCLVPEQSASYPTSRETLASGMSRRPSPKEDPADAVIGGPDSYKSNTTSDAGEAAPAVAAASPPLPDSSRSSSSATSDRFRFLKLGPVYWGGQPGVGDWAEPE